MYRNRVSIGNWACADVDPVVDQNGCKIKFKKITGWFDTPDVRSDPIPRPGNDGSWDGQPTLDSRFILVEGSITGRSGAAVQASMDDLAAILTGEVRYDFLTVEEASRGISRQSLVRLGGQTLFNRQGAWMADFSLSLLAPDQIRYSSELHSVTVPPFSPGGGFSFDLTFDLTFGDSGTSGIVSIENNGIRPTWPVLRLPGPVTNPSVRLVGGGTVAPVIDLLTGQELVIDCGARTVLLDGVSRRQVLVKDDFFSLPIGQSQIYYSVESGSGDLTVEWRDAW